MSDVTVTFTGGAEFARALDDWKQRTVEASKAGLKAAGAEVARETRNSFGQPGGPQIVSGALADSVITTDPSQGPEGWEVRVGPAGLDYVRRVELGKRAPRSAGPHPFFRPGFDRAGARFVEIFRSVWTDAQPGR